MNTNLFALSFLAPFLVLFSTITASADSNPSFNCNKASIESEFAICRWDDLGYLDQQLAVAYKAARANASQGQRNLLVAGQRAWIAQRNSCGWDVACLSNIMHSRIEQLKWRN